ncbi:lysosomal alpha-glucosidase-like [Centruroides sculpturatus]|uniref:lysosomal alpha-glucosidase-like n=1 Tax=Centruroides sculpturatus TaxID=218467 RepID=UPI000C6DB631|nr:lysosomal alpha-glucosidase-like [Centruroides sculpturatus]XP_023237281.1 lysosomal alpha-glucosidase-like [Centruroides sculpturatus]
MEMKKTLLSPHFIQHFEYTSPAQRSKLIQRVLLTAIKILLLSLLVSSLIYWLVQYEFNHSLSWNDIKYWLDKDDVKNQTKKFEPNCNIMIPDNEKFDCHPDFPASEKDCLNRGCCWNANQNIGDKNQNIIPNCYFPSNYIGYEVKNIEKELTKISALLQRTVPSNFPSDVKYVNLTVYFYDRNTIRIRLTDANSTRFEIPYPEETRDLGGLYGKWKRPLYMKYAIFLDYNGELLVNRLSNRETVFKTDLKRLIFSHQFLQLSSLLPSKYIYGLGQHKSPLLKNTKWNLITFFNKGRHLHNEETNSGSHPFYLVMEKNGNSHGVVLLNSNAMDIMIQPTPAITFRPVGGIFDFFVFLGPKPNDVIQQYTKIIGTTLMPPYWSLGSHLFNYNSDDLKETANISKRTKLTEMPLDAIWEVNVQRHNGFVYDNRKYEVLSKLINHLHNIGLHYIFTLDPGTGNAESLNHYSPYDDGLKMDVFVKDKNGQILIGKGRNGTSVVFPDFLHPNITDYWTKQFKHLYSQVEIDGVLIDMNEPTNYHNGKNECPNTSYEYPSYMPHNLKSLHSYTLCMSSKHHNAMHYNVHNMYGFMEAIVTNGALVTVSKKKPFIISRSSFPGLGHYAGVLDDNSFSWNDIRLSVSSILSFNMFGIPMVGTNICGLVRNADVDLYSRWMALESFYPFFIRCNLDKYNEQDSDALHSQVVSAIKETVMTRYFFLPYLYTLFRKSYRLGNAVARPLFFEYTTDRNTYFIDDQFLWGESLMIIPVLNPNKSKVNAYFPRDTWYDFHTSKIYNNTGTRVILHVPLGTVKLTIRGGYIIPGQIPANTTLESRLNPFYLIVALNSSKMAIGDLYWDDGESIQSEYNYISFKAKSNTLTMNPVLIKYKNMPKLGYVKVLGCEDWPKSVNANSVPASFDYYMDEKVLIISNLTLSLLESNSISWIF